MSADVRKSTIQPDVEMKISESEKKEEDVNGKKKDGESGDETNYEKKDSPLEIGEHYLVKRGEDAWSKLVCCVIFVSVFTIVLFF